MRRDQIHGYPEFGLVLKLCKTEINGDGMSILSKGNRVLTSISKGSNTRAFCFTAPFYWFLDVVPPLPVDQETSPGEGGTNH